MKQFQPQVVMMPIDRITPYATNAKNHPRAQIDKLKAGIAKFGWDVPIVVDEDNVIIKGHGRRLAALELGLKQVPAIVRTDLTEAEKMAARLHDNKSAESSYDPELLKAEMAALEEMNFDLTLTGFGLDEMENFFLGDAPDFDEVGADEQGRLDERKPKEFNCVCPECGHGFIQQI